MQLIASLGSYTNLKSPPGLLFHLHDPAAAILLFASGKLVCTNTKAEHEVRRAIAKLKQSLQATGRDDKYVVDVLETQNAVPTESQGS
jgi:transcription initiation factor TFIID TATA-box-binding protein